ncbi:MAG TPA: acyl-CoA dehydrogenase family protein [Candidatus Kryptonia bacterium]|nr:acyl-CoA dehydrogenase family protein [Candidatus Kryptonia bacterium]
MTESTATPISAARRLAAGIRDRADEIERERRLPAELVAALSEAGLFRLCVPRSLGGGEVDVTTMIRAIEEIAYADGSAGWCVMIGATSGLVSGYLAADAAREIYGAASAITGGVFAPLGNATVVESGYRVSGRWAFASGCQHCGWLMGGCVVFDDGKPRLLSSGLPDSRMMLFPLRDVEIIDTWTVAGLRGTGSHDMAVKELFVPAERSVALVTDRPQQSGPLYAFPVFGLLALGIAGVALGIARNAIDELIRLAGAKTPSGSRRKLADRAVIQMQVAQAEALLRSARAFLFETVNETWQAAQSEGAISIQRRALLRLAATHTTISCAGVVDLMYNAGGGTSIYATNPLQRCFRDIHVVTQHMMVAPPTFELAGRFFLGLDADASML